MAQSNPITYREQNEPGFYLVDPIRSVLNYTCDIILIHGLNGGPTHTWQNEETQSIWFQDMLPFYVANDTQGPNARIWSFGYNANTAFGTAIAGVEDYARQLLDRVSSVRQGCEDHGVIWVCHSLGGIVAKKALIEAKRVAIYSSILDSTRAMIFLGTPHKGSGAANIGYVAAKIYRKTMLFGRPNDSLLRTLSTNSSALQSIAEDFEKSCGSIEIYTYYEMLPIAISRSLIVPSESAITGLRNEVAVPLNANHRSICKYRNIRDPNWLVIRDRLVMLVRGTAPVSTLNPTRTPAPSLDTDESKRSEVSPEPGASSLSPHPAMITSTNSRETKIRGWRCNLCRERILPSHLRYRCLDCNNYDICASCQPTGQVSLNHTEDHKLQKILETQLLAQDDLTLIHAEQGVDSHMIEQLGPGWLALRHLDPLLVLTPDAAHARFLVTPLPRGNYQVVFIIGLRFLKRQSAGAHGAQTLLRNELGTLRAAAGSPKGKFFQSGQTEDDSLVFETLETGSFKDGRLPASYGTYKIKLDAPVTVLQDYMGLALQWSGGRVFQSPEDSLSVSIVQLRLERLDPSDTSALVGDNLADVEDD